MLPIKKELEEKGISVKYDNRETHKPGWKFAEYEFKGVPLRLTIGPRDIENGTVEVARRDTLEKRVIDISDIVTEIPILLDEIQRSLFEKSLTFREKHTYSVDTWNEFLDVIENKGGFAYAHWDGTSETEEKIKEKTKATVRIIPFHNPKEEGTCIFSGKPSSERVLFARAY